MEKEVKKLQISPNELTLCISIAEHPSKFGTAVINAAFTALGLNYLYKAIAVNPEKLEDAIKGIRALGIRGCGISMPFKTKAIGYIDEIDPTSEKIGAINTLVNDNGLLRGYNTDYFGMMEAINAITLSDKNIVLLGAGGMANAVLGALKQKGAREITICNRSSQKGKEVASKWGCQFSAWENRNDLKADILVNTTSIGMYNNPGLPLDASAIGNFNIVIDVIVDPIQSELIKLAKENQKLTIPGYKISLFRAAKQFELYTGKKAPLEVMEKAMLELM